MLLGHVYGTSYDPRQPLVLNLLLLGNGKGSFHPTRTPRHANMHGLKGYIS